MPRTHAKHKPGESLGSISRDNGDVLQVARRAHCGKTLFKPENLPDADVNWRTAAEHTQAMPRLAKTSKI